MFGSLQLGGNGKIMLGLAHLFQQRLYRCPTARARIADIDPFALQVSKNPDPTILARDNSEGFGMERKNRPEIFKSPLLLKNAAALQGMVLPIGLGDANVQIAFADRPNIINRRPRSLDRTAQTMVCPMAVDHAADGGPGRIINPRHPTSANGDKVIAILLAASRQA